MPKRVGAQADGSCDLLARVNAIPFYSRVSGFSRGFLPSKQAIVDSAVKLRALSTYVHGTDAKANEALETISKRVARIEKDLCLEPLEQTTS